MNYPTITGLDIGHHSIKAASVRLKRSQLELVGYHEIPLPRSVFVEDGSLLNESVEQYLSQLKREVNFTQKKVAFSIPDSCVMSKQIQLEIPLDEKEIESSLIYAFEKQTSLPSEALNIDFFALNQLEKSSSEITVYQVFATRKEIVHTRQKYIEGAGFSAVLAEVSSHALLALWQRGVMMDPDKKSWMLVDIGYRQTTFCIISLNKELYSKQVSFGASMAQSIHNRAQYITQLSEHLARQITLYSSIYDHKVEGIWVTGGGSLLPELSNLLSDELALPVLELNLLSLFQSSSKSLSPAGISMNQYASALGLGLRGIEWLTK